MTVGKTIRAAGVLATAGLALAGCKKPVEQSLMNEPAVPAGYADGIKTTDTKGLIFSATGKGVAIDSAGVYSISDIPIVYRTTSDPNVIIATVSGQDIKMTFNVANNEFFGSNANYELQARIFYQAPGNQSMLTNFKIASKPLGIGDQIGFVTTGLETDPTTVAALTGSATYYGTGFITVAHGDAGQPGWGYGDGAGSATLTADFNAGTIGGSMILTDNGNTSSTFALAPNTVITINSAPITGNGFTTTLSATPSDLAMSSITSSSVSGTFYGIVANDVGGTFSGTGVSADGTTPANFYGGFLAQ